MKKNSILWAALPIMAVAFMTTACSSDDSATQTPLQQSTAKSIPYTVTVNSAATTRATVESDNKTLYFATGDKLYITGTNVKGVLDIQEGTGTASATFSGDLAYSGEGSPAADLELTATLVSAQQSDGAEIAVNATTGAVTVNYPSTAYCADVAAAVQKYSNLTGTSTYGSKSFSLSQQTAFLNFVITFEDGTATGTALSAVVSNNSAAICTADVTTVTESEKVVAKFVLPIAGSTALSGATVKMGDKDAIAFGASQTLAGKVYNVAKTQAETITAVTSVALDADKMTLTVGDDGQLTATVAPEDATDKTVTWSSDKESVATVDATGKVTAVAEGTATITAQAGDKTATCVVTVTDAPIAIDLSTLTAAYEAQNGDVLTGELSAKVKISIADGATVTLDGITINGTTGRSYNWAGITCVGDATIILKDGTTNTVKGFNSEYSGIFVPKDKTLTIKGETEGTGKLIASSNGDGAGIGGGDGISSTAKNCGNIVIQGGVITATGGSKSAGIGSGGYGSCGDITISGGTVTATGGEMSAAIGSGYGSASCGKITITDGVTSVTATKGSYSPNSIGAGDYGSTCGTVTIGGNVGVITVSPYIYPAPTVGDVGNPIGFDGGGDPLANN